MVERRVEQNRSMGEVLPDRSLEQKACDRLFLLWLIKKTSPLDAYKLQKLPFRLEYELCQEGKRAFNYEFFQYYQGPLSIEVYEDRDFLKEQSLISVHGYTAEITGEGEAFLSQFDHVLRKNEALARKLAEIADRFSGKTGGELVTDTHDIVVQFNGNSVKLGDLPRHTTILEKPEKTCIEIDPPTLETLVVLFDSELVKNLREARREGRTSSPYKPLITA
jgi:hypothetical protein